MNNYFILHGSFSNPFGNWFPWLRAEIEKTKPSGMEESICYVPHMPTGIEFQNYNNWENVIKPYLSAGGININTTIFAHSISPIFICKFLIKHNIRVKRLVFVCGFNNHFIEGADDYNKVNETMFCEGVEKIKDLCDDITCIYSNNDPYVKFDVEKEFADKVSHKQIMIENGGHLNAESGYTEFPLLKDFI